MNIILVYLILSLSCSIAIFLCFKYFKIFSVPLLPAIIFNYLTCFVVGGILHVKGFSEINGVYLQSPWFPYAFGLGVLFIFVFLLMGRTTQKLGLAPVSIASKMSLVFPAILSITILKTGQATIPLLAGIILAFPAIVLSSQKEGNQRQNLNIQGLLLPLGVFIGSGLVDGTLNWVNANFSESPGFQFFPAGIFGFASLTGIIYVSISSKSISPLLNKKALFGGIALGLPNYFSIEFLLLGLSSFSDNGALVFPFLNVSIILISSLVGFILFNESFSRKNLIGLTLALLAIIALASDL